MEPKNNFACLLTSISMIIPKTSQKDDLLNTSYPKTSNVSTMVAVPKETSHIKIEQNQKMTRTKNHLKTSPKGLFN